MRASRKPINTRSCPSGICTSDTNLSGNWSQLLVMSFSRQELYLHQIRISNAVLQFNISAGRGLALWKWYVLRLL